MSAHLVSVCVVCQSQTDAFLCGDARTGAGCLGLLIQRLGDCAWLSDQLDTTLSRQDKVAAASVGFVTGSTEKPLSFNLGASDAAMNLRDKLCSWVRCLWEDNTSSVLHCGGCGLEQESHAEGPQPYERTWYYAHRAIDVEPDMVSTSRWLMRHPSWIAFHPAADEIHDELSNAIGHAFHSIDILGKCGFEMNGEWCQHELYARPRATEVVCQICGSEWVVEERLRFLRSIAEDQVLQIPALSRLLAALGFDQATEKAIRSKAQAGVFKAMEKQAHGRSSFRAGDVMDAFMKAEEPVAA
jgi:hypothetical protein